LNVAERAKQLRLIILDACRDNPFANQMKRTQTVATRSAVRGLVAVEPEAGTLVVYAVICARPCLRGLCGSGMRSPIATNKICRRVATSVVVGNEDFSIVILQVQYWPSLVGEEAEVDRPCKTNFILRQKACFKQCAFVRDQQMLVVTRSFK